MCRRWRGLGGPPVDGRASGTHRTSSPTIPVFSLSVFQQLDLGFQRSPSVLAHLSTSPSSPAMPSVWPRDRPKGGCEGMKKRLFLFPLIADFPIADCLMGQCGSAPRGATIGSTVRRPPRRGIVCWTARLPYNDISLISRDPAQPSSAFSALAQPWP